MLENMKVIANTSPLIALDKIGEAKLLKLLYGRIYCAEAVISEIKEGIWRQPAGSILLKADWIEIVSDPSELPLKYELGAGEAATITIALKKKIDLVILDDKVARDIAKVLGLKVTGTYGVVLSAKEKGLIKSAGKIFIKLKESGLWIDDETLKTLLKEAGE